MGRETIGIGCVALFALSTALRDVYLAATFQGVSVFVLNVLAFGAATALFGLWCLVFRRADFRRMWARPGDLAALCLGTSAAWLCYFLALADLPPAVVNTLHTGIGPLTVLAIAAIGVHVPTLRPSLGLQRVAQIGAGVALAALVLALLVDRPLAAWPQVSVKLALALLSGVLITANSVAGRRLNDTGISAAALMAVRFAPLVLLSAGVVAFSGDGLRFPPPARSIEIAALAGVLIVAPSYALQYGTALAPIMAGRIVVALGPLLVVAAQALEGRVALTGATLACIAAYGTVTVAGLLAVGAARAIPPRPRAPAR